MSKAGLADLLDEPAFTVGEIVEVLHGKPQKIETYKGDRVNTTYVTGGMWIPGKITGSAVRRSELKCGCTRFYGVVLLQPWGQRTECACRIRERGT